MPQITTNDLKNGMALDLRDGLFTVVGFQHVNPGKGAAFVRTRLRNVRSGAVLERTFRAGERVEHAILEHRQMQLLYSERDHHVFMDSATYEQIEVPDSVLGEARDHLVAGSNVTLRFYGSDIIGVDLPASVELTITDAEPGIQGDRVSGATKSATLETGKVIQVPLFIKAGDRIKVDTRTGGYIARA